METLEKTIADLPVLRAPHGLRTRILACVAEAAERSVRRYRIFFGSLSFASAALMVPATWMALQDLSGSAFVSYLSLLFTDGGAVIANWKSLALLLAESAPVTGLTLAFAAMFALLASVRWFGRYVDSPRLVQTAS